MPSLSEKIGQLEGKVHTYNLADISPIQASIQEEKNTDLTQNDVDNFDKTSWIKLRTSYANKLYWLLSGEIIGLFLIIVLVGFEKIKLDPWVINIFSTAVIAQSFGLVRVIVKNLFDRNTTNITK